MDRLQELLALSPGEKAARGVEHTPREIRQQPDAWRETVARFREKEAGLAGFLEAAGVRGNPAAEVVLMGAGSSEYVGWAAQEAVSRGLRATVTILPTTTFLTHPGDQLVPGRTRFFVHFARSGDSPESVATLESARTILPGSHHLVITCNGAGRLAAAAAAAPAREDHFLLVLPEMTNDRSLVMTSSFTSMTLAVIALAHIGGLAAFEREVDAAAAAVENLFAREVERIRGFAEQAASRIQFLGTGGAYGAMKESRLKVLEMTDGIVAANVDTFLGIRHGPRVFVNKDCLVAASLSSDPSRRGYEVDLLRELRDARQGKKLLVVCDRPAADLAGIADETVPLAPDGPDVAPGLRPITDVVIGQLIGLFACLSHGLKPDAPSRAGVIRRVVPGFTLH